MEGVVNIAGHGGCAPTNQQFKEICDHVAAESWAYRREWVREHVADKCKVVSMQIGADSVAMNLAIAAA